LEDHGLYPAIRTKEEKVRLQNIPCFTEEDVFKVLGLQYKPPEDRNV
jgi:DNA polymerase/3'-5' exonuclease PolX